MIDLIVHSLSEWALIMLVNTDGGINLGEKREKERNGERERAELNQPQFVLRPVNRV